MGPLFLVMTGGALGAGGRWALTLGTQRLIGTSGWPVGTLAANVLGGLAMGVLAAMLTRGAATESLRLFAGVGVLGGFTTFSAFSLEVFSLWERHQWAAGLGYAALSVLGAVAALAVGYASARSLLGGAIA